jgi:DNA-binding transcriptional ArsR family regulator
MFGNVVLRDSAITLQARMLYALLVSYCWKPKISCYVSKKTLAAHLGVTSRTVYTYTRELEEAGLIHVETRGDGFTNLYTIMPLSRRYGPSIADDLEKYPVAGIGEEGTFHSVGNFYPEAWNNGSMTSEPDCSLGRRQVEDEDKKTQEEDCAVAPNSYPEAYPS